MMLDVRIENCIINLDDVVMIERVEERLLFTFKSGTTKIIRMKSVEECESIFDVLWKRVKYSE